MKKLPPFALLAAATLLVGYALTVPVVTQKGAFFSDEATYYSMAYSLAYDGDLRYEAHDLERVYEHGYAGGPSGLFLVRDGRTGRLYHAKAFAYPLAAAPFVRLFGDNGFFLLHALLLCGVLLCGHAYLARTLASPLASAWVLAYFAASIALLYYFWLTPEIFNLALGFFATFLWLYKERPPGWPADAAWEPPARLRGAWTDVAAAALYGVAAYSKPPSVILLGPLLAWMLLQRRWGRALALGAVAAVVIVALFGATHLATGNLNYMGGDRRSFTGPYPFQYANQPFDTIGTPMITEVSEYQDRLPRPDHLAADLAAYLWVGRNAGLLVYMLPAVLAALAWLGARHRRWLSPYSLLLAAAAANALAYMTVIQANWIGGGGAIGSRYFVGLYYAPFFAIPAGAGLLAPALAWLVWAVFLAQVVLNPFASSRSPGMHTKSFPFTMLPPEMGMLNDLPFNTDPRARRVMLDPDDPDDPNDSFDPFDLYFLDDGTYLREGDLGGFWVKSRRRAEVVLRTSRPPATIVFELRNGPAANRIRVAVDGQAQTVTLEPDQTTTLRLHLTTRFTFGDEYVFRLIITSESGGVPMLHAEANEDFRALGVFVGLRVEES